MVCTPDCRSGGSGFDPRHRRLCGPCLTVPVIRAKVTNIAATQRPSGLTVMSSPSQGEDCGFDSRLGHLL